VIAGGIAIDDPDQATVMHYHVGIAVLAQKRRPGRATRSLMLRRIMAENRAGWWQ